MTAVFASGSNVFVPNYEASGRLQVEFSRNANSFALNKYIQIQKAPKVEGKYLRITTEEAGRILNTDGSDFAWDYGADRPMHNEGQESFEFLPYKTQRFDLGFNVPYETNDQADWDFLSSHIRIKAQQAMTLRAQAAATVLGTTGNYAAANTSAVASIPGNTGTWAASTVARQDIRRSIQHAVEVINTSTLGAVKNEDLVLVMGPTAARKVAESQEIVDYLKGSPHSMPYVQMTGNPNVNRNWGLPNELYGVQVIVDDTSKTTNAKGATRASSYVWSDKAVLLSRPGGLEGGTGPSFSTCTMFAYEDMTVEQIDDTRNRRIEGHVVDNRVFVLTAPAAGFLFTTVYS